MGTLRYRLTFFYICIILVCTALTSFLAINMAEGVLIKEQISNIEGVIAVLESEIEGDFEFILARRGLTASSKDEQINGLREELQPLVNKVARAYPDMKVTIFSRELNAEVASEESLHRYVYIASQKEPLQSENVDSTKPQVEVRPSVLGKTLYIKTPLIRAGRVIGYITVKHLLTHVFNAKRSFSLQVMVLTILVIFIGWIGLIILSKEVLVDIDKIKAWIERLQYDLTDPFPGVTGDLGIVAQAIEELSTSLYTLQETSRGLAGSLYLEDAIEHALDMVVKVFGAKHCALLLYDSATQELRIRGSYGLSDEYVQAVRIRIGESISGTVLQTGKTMSSSDLNRDRRNALPQLVWSEGMISMLSTPLSSREKCIGVVNVYSKQKYIYSANEITLLSTLANQIALSLENAMLFEEMETRAITDRLTGLYNHKHLHEVLNFELREAERFSRPLSLLLLDIDYFKSYNDSFGHQAGDILLKKIAHILKESVRPDDCVGRYGGEEFVIILKDLSAVRAREVAERIRLAIERYPFAGRERQPMGAVTVSGGIAQYPLHAGGVEEMVKKADEALYKGKFTGRNKIEVYYSVLDTLAGLLNPEEKKYLEEIKTIISVISAKDKYTFGHSERVMEYARAIAVELALPVEEINWITYAAYLHDIGKIEVPWDLLANEQTLTHEDWQLIHRHPVWSKTILETIPTLQPTFDMILHHHEWYNGQGYPKGIKGLEIALGARIIAIGDCFDAMTTTRRFQEAMTREKALAEMRRQAGTQFDPELVEVFIRIIRSAS